MVVAVAAGPAQDVGDEGQAGLALRGLLNGDIDLGLGGWLDAGLLIAVLVLALGAVGLELALDLVRVQGARLLAVGLGDVVLGCRREDAEDVVEGGRGVGLMGRDLVADAEDFSVWGATRRRSAVIKNVASKKSLGSPSLLHAAVRGLSRARSPMERWVSFMLALRCWSKEDWPPGRVEMMSFGPWDFLDSAKKLSSLSSPHPARPKGAGTWYRPGTCLNFRHGAWLK